MRPYAACPLCHGRGGYYLPKLDGGRRWAKCARCKPSQTRIRAREQALTRYLSGNRNPHAYHACINLGMSAEQIKQEQQAYDNARKRLFDGNE